jgi:hypothetical protein
MNQNLVFRTGKYKGKTVGEVLKIDINYVVWVKENRPEMLNDRTPKKEVTIETPKPVSKSIPTINPEDAF